MWKQILLLRFSLMILPLFLNIFANAQIHDRDMWALRMVHNLRWDTSNNFLAVYTESADGKKEHLGIENLPGYEGAKMSFFYGLGYKNMLINFDTDEDTGAAYCKIGVIPDDITEKIIEERLEHQKNNCTYQRKKIYKNDGPFVNKEKFTAFCPIEPKGELVKWIVANGTFNRPAKAPQCLYDFHTAARANSFEYDLLRYCAKGYFFNGRDYDHPANIPSFRKDWLLYLAEGSVTCGISGNSEEDKSLLAKGYTVELVHPFDFDQVNNLLGLQECPDLEATLTSYHDNDSEGKFFFAAVVGPGQLDNYFQWSDRPNVAKQFWAEETYKEEYKTMTIAERGCYLHYHNWSKRKDGRYYLELRVIHHCTGRAMRETIYFDVSTGRENAPEGFHEDRGILIDLSAKMLRRTTGQTLCAKEMPLPNPKDQNSQQPPCVRPPRSSFQYKRLGEICDQKQNQCLSFGSKCTLPENAPACAVGMNETCYERDLLECGACVCRKVVLNSKCEYDWHCAEHMFCADGNECKKKHYKESGESCWSHSECFPDSGCYRLQTGNEHFGICSNVNYKECPHHKGHTCIVFKCPKGQKWSDECTKFVSSTEESVCKKKTNDIAKQVGPFPGGLDGCGVPNARLRCCL